MAPYWGYRLNMKEIEFIDHIGVVIAKEGQLLSVEVINRSACSGCHAKGVCMLGDEKVKVVEIESSSAYRFEVGERVNLKLQRSLGYKALWISYLIPLIILMVLLLSLHTVGLSELAIGLSIIALLSLYYLIVWLFKDRFKREFIFIVEKL